MSHFKSIIKNNKTTILISFCTTLLTTLIVVMVGGEVLNSHSLKFEREERNNQTKAVEMTEPKDNKNDSITNQESRIVTIVEKASPAVVSIVITKDVPVIERYYEDFNPFGNDFFGNLPDFRIPQQRQNGTEKREVGGGSGFFVSEDGYLVTNRHVVEDDTAEYTVLTNDGEKYNAKILAKDSILDVAILKVDGHDFPYLTFGNSDDLKVGQTVVAIGNALGEFRNSVSVGVVSGLSRSIVAGNMFGKREQLEGVIQTDAAINPGNSGGPLLDSNGKVIGINVAVEQGAQNIGFALASNTAESIVNSVKESGEIIRPYLGMRYIPITKSLKEKNDLPVDYGILVSRGETAEDLAIIPGSPADKAGIVENDIVLEVDGVSLDSDKYFANIIRQKEVGQKVSLKLLHKGKEKIVEVMLEKAPKNL